MAEHHAGWIAWQAFIEDYERDYTDEPPPVPAEPRDTAPRDDGQIDLFS